MSTPPQLYRVWPIQYRPTLGDQHLCVGVVVVGPDGQLAIEVVAKAAAVVKLFDRRPEVVTAVDLQLRSLHAQLAPFRGSTVDVDAITGAGRRLGNAIRLGDPELVAGTTLDDVTARLTRERFPWATPAPKRRTPKPAAVADAYADALTRRGLDYGERNVELVLPTIAAKPLKVVHRFMNGRENNVIVAPDQRKQVAPVDTATAQLRAIASATAIARPGSSLVALIAGNSPTYTGELQSRLGDEVLVFDTQNVDELAQLVANAAAAHP